MGEEGEASLAVALKGIIPILPLPDPLGHQASGKPLQLLACAGLQDRQGRHARPHKLPGSPSLALALRLPWVRTDLLKSQQPPLSIRSINKIGNYRKINWDDVLYQHRV